MKKQVFRLFVVFFLVLSGTVSASTLLKLLIWEGYAPQEKVRQFEESMSRKYGTEVRLHVSTRVSDPQAFFDAIRLEEGGYHIISPAHNLLKDERFDLIGKGLLLAIDPERLPHYKELLPSLIRAAYITDKGRVYGVPFAHGPYGIIYNTRHFNTPPESLNVLWEDAYKNRYCISGDYYEANIFLTAMSLGMRGEDIWRFEKLNASKKFKERLRSLAQNASKLWIGVDRPKDFENMVLGTTWGFSLPDLTRKGEDWKRMEPVEGYTGWVDNFLIAKHVEKDPFLRSLAEEWLNFVISPAYQAEVVVRQLGSDPVNPQAAQFLTPEEIARHHLDDPAYFHTRRVLWPTMDRRNRNALKLLWQQAIAGRP